MNRAEIRDTLDRINSLAAEVESHVPAENGALADFRADLAGLLVVTACATYETCVKQIIYNYAGRHSPIFKIYAENKYNKINSRIDVGDLHAYAKTFHPNLGTLFKNNLSRTCAAYLDRTSVDIKQSYSQMLEWRHSFAHTGARVTTVEEALRHHRYAKRVIFTFADTLQNFGG